tara:strand:- start:410 stop:643 length:234 start_codon:yes stop_codon:yes gene_type:complete
MQRLTLINHRSQKLPLSQRLRWNWNRRSSSDLLVLLTNALFATALSLYSCNALIALSCDATLLFFGFATGTRVEGGV